VRAYSLDLRQRVLADCDAGLSTKVVAAKFTVSTAWVRRLKQRRRTTGEVAPRKSSGAKPKLLAHHDRLRQLAQAHPGLTAAEYHQRLGVAAVCVLTVWRTLRRLGLTFKKKSSAPPSRTAPTSPKGGRRGARK